MKIESRLLNSFFGDLDLIKDFLFNNVSLICLRVISILFNRVFYTTNYPLSLVTFCLRC